MNHACEFKHSACALTALSPRVGKAVLATYALAFPLPAIVHSQGGPRTVPVRTLKSIVLHTRHGFL